MAVSQRKPGPGDVRKGEWLIVLLNLALAAQICHPVDDKSESLVRVFVVDMVLDQ